MQKIRQHNGRALNNIDDVFARRILCLLCNMPLINLGYVAIEHSHDKLKKIDKLLNFIFILVVNT